MQNNKNQFMCGLSCGLTVGLFVLLSAQLSYQASPLEDDKAVVGKKLFQQNKCSTCHTIEESGGCLAPPLDDVGNRRGKDFILARITDSKTARKNFSKYHIQELMPHPRVAPSVANELANYLSELRSDLKALKVGRHKIDTSAVQSSTHVSSAKSRDKGKTLFYTKGCMECHSVLGGGGQFAPALDGISKRQERGYLLARMTGAELLELGVSGEYHEKGTNMPPSNLSPDEIESIADFLMSLPPRK